MFARLQVQLRLGRITHHQSRRPHQSHCDMSLTGAFEDQLAATPSRFPQIPAGEPNLRRYVTCFGGISGARNVFRFWNTPRLNPTLGEATLCEATLGITGWQQLKFPPSVVFKDMRINARAL